MLADFDIAWLLHPYAKMPVAGSYQKKVNSIRHCFQQLKLQNVEWSSLSLWPKDKRLFRCKTHQNTHTRRFLLQNLRDGWPEKSGRILTTVLVLEVSPLAHNLSIWWTAAHRLCIRKLSRYLVLPLYCKRNRNKHSEDKYWTQKHTWATEKMHLLVGW